MFFLLPVNRWFTSPVTLKMPSSLIIIITNYLNFTTTKETWKNSLNISWMTKVCVHSVHKTFYSIDITYLYLNNFFCGNLVLYSPFFPHLLDAWSKRNHPNLHFMFFEDMKKVIKAFSLFN